MKGISKISVFALGLLTLASCTSDDFLGSSKNASGKQELVINVESPNGEDGMRSAFVPTSMNIVWQKTDVFRVFDDQMSKYDSYKFDGTAVVLDGTQNVEAHAYAMFPANQLAAASWDAKLGLRAELKLPAVVELADPVVENGKTAYVSALPMWGITKNETAEKLEVDLKHLAAYTDITVYKQYVDSIRVLALNAEPSAPIVANTNAIPAAQFDAATPLSGWFAAQMQEDYENSMIVADGSIRSNEYASYVKVELTNNTADETHVYIPIPPAKYKYLLIQKCIGTTWSDVKAYKNTTINRNVLIKTGLELGTPPIAASAYSIKNLNDVLKAQANADALVEGAVIDVDLTKEDLKTPVAGLTTLGEDASKSSDEDRYFNNQIILPSAADGSKDVDDVTINIKGNIDASLANRDFVIRGGTAGNTVRLNIEGKVTGNQKIVIKSPANLVLGGEFACTSQNLEIDATAGEVTFGRGDAAPFSSSMPVVNKGTSKITVDAGNGTIASVNPENDNSNMTVDVKSGTVTNIGNSKKINGAVTVTGGQVGTLKTNNGAVSVSGAEVTTIETTGTGTVTLDEEAEVKDVTSKGAVTVTNSVISGTLKLNAASLQVTLTGSDDDDDPTIAKIATINVNNQNTPTITSAGKAVILNVTGIKSGSEPTISSTWNHEDNAVNDINANGEIYTAAQLGAVTTGKNYVLRTNVTVSTGDLWTPLSLSGKFDVDGSVGGGSKNGLTISGLQAPLFGAISGTSVVGEAGHIVSGATQYYKLTISGTSIEGCEDADQGALAGVTSGNLTVQNVEVVDVNIQADEEAEDDAINYGGLIGRAGGSLTLKNVKVSTKNSDGKIKAYANIGGYVGNFEGTSFEATVTASSTYAGTVAFEVTNEGESDAAKALVGTVGYFIGSVTTKGTAQLNILPTALQSGQCGNVLTDYFSGDAFSSLNFSANKNAAGATFRGLKHHEIGFSTATAIDLNLYGAFNGWQKEDIKHKDDINKYGPYDDDI